MLLRININNDNLLLRVSISKARLQLRISVTKRGLQLRISSKNQQQESAIPLQSTVTLNRQPYIKPLAMTTMGQPGESSSYLVHEH